MCRRESISTRSDAGKRLLEKVPVIIREANESGGQLVQQKLEAYSEELERKLADLPEQSGSTEAGCGRSRMPRTATRKATDGKSK